jgi:hypothetical protein
MPKVRRSRTRPASLVCFKLSSLDYDYDYDTELDMRDEQALGVCLKRVPEETLSLQTLRWEPQGMFNCALCTFPTGSQNKLIALSLHLS